MPFSLRPILDTNKKYTSFNPNDWEDVIDPNQWEDVSTPNDWDKKHPYLSGARDIAKQAGNKLLDIIGSSPAMEFAKSTNETPEQKKQITPTRLRTPGELTQDIIDPLGGGLDTTKSQPSNVLSPITAPIEDVKNKNYGGAGVDLLMLAAMGKGGYEAFNRAFPKPSANLGNIEPITTPVPQVNIRGLLPASTAPDVAGNTRFIGTPSGKIGDLTNPNTAEALTAEGLSRPPVGSYFPSQNLGVGNVAELGRPPIPTNFNAGRTNLDIQSPGVPRSMGVNPETRLPTGDIFGTVPPRMMGSPIEASLRDLALGGRRGDITAEPSTISQGYGPENWAGTPSTVDLGTMGGSKPLPDILPPNEPNLPSAPVTRRLKKVTGQVVSNEPAPTTVESVISKSPDLGNKQIGKVGGLVFVKDNPVFKKIMDKWINTRAQSPFIGSKILDQFSDTLKDMKPEDLPILQKALKDGLYPEIRKAFDDAYANLKANGIDIDKKENYLPQMWKDKPEAIKQAFGDKRLSTNAPFTQQSLFQDYAQGIQAGLTPKMAPLDLMKWYFERANRLVADTNAWRDLRKEGYINIQGKEASAGQPILNNKYLPGGWKAEGSKFAVNYTADPRVQWIVENYLKSQNDGGILHGIGSLSGRSAGLALSGSLPPKTPALSGHGINTLVNAGLDSPKQFFKAVKAGTTDVWFKKNAEYFKANRDTAIDAVGSGLKLANSDMAYKPLMENAKGLPGKVVNKIDKLSYDWYRKPLFDEMIPKVMLESWKDMVAKGVEKSEASRRVNDIYGHVNTDLLYRSKQFQNFSKSLLFAPNWIESRLRLGGMTPDQKFSIVTNPKYAAVAGKLVGSYAVANMVNYANSGHFMWDNDTGREFDVAMGKDSDGTDRYVKLFGTSGDYLKIPAEIATSIIKKESGEKIGQVLYNKTTIPNKIGVDLFRGHDSLGNANIMSSTDRFGRKIPFTDRLANTTADFSQLALPSTGKGLVDIALGRNPEKALAESMQLPLVYGFPKKGKSPFGKLSFK